ncbi:hypothetical protein C8F01DRAFT_1377091 [Mycena amicta]|nr:hypothetical protein C8F01DRAFT_1377091 [Mycena amicta]
MSLHPLALCVVSVTVGCFLWQKYCNRPPAWMKQMEALGRKRDKLIPGTAVVCGGSVSGTIAARICADHFERVVVVDPDIGNAEKDRTRIVQRNAAHVYLCLFVAGARRLWPGFDAEVERAGGRFEPADLQLHYSGVELLTPYKDYPQGKFPSTLVMRRSAVQKVLHRLLLGAVSAVADIRVLAGTVRGFRSSSDKQSIESVTVRCADGTQIQLEDVSLVVVKIAPGRTQEGFKWLKSAGYPHFLTISGVATIQVCAISLTRSPSRRKFMSELPIPRAQRKAAIVYTYVPHDDTQACLFAIVRSDNDVVQCLFGDTGSMELPRDPADMVPFIERFAGSTKPIPVWVIETVKMLVERCGAPTIDPIKLAPLQYIRYHSITDEIPSNFIALGDAGLFLNPIHGQGFAKAMMNGITLNSLLHSLPIVTTALPPNFSTRYFKMSASCTEGLWDATRLHDYGSVSCTPMEGETKDSGRVVRWVEKKLITAATQDEQVASALWHVRQMLAAESVLLAPSILWKVLTTPSMFA